VRLFQSFSLKVRVLILASLAALGVYGHFTQEPAPSGPSATCLAGQRLYANAQVSDLSINAQLQAYERMLDLC
jgi:hypothetical protein